MGHATRRFCMKGNSDLSALISLWPKNVVADLDKLREAIAAAKNFRSLMLCISHWSASEVHH
jgi:hypothetical protein